MIEIRRYVTREGKDIYGAWHDHLRDARAQLAIDRRLQRLQLGNFGDHKPCGDGLWELRVDVGAGYRVYYGVFSSYAVGISPRNRLTSGEPKITGRIGRSVGMRDRSHDEAMAEYYSEHPEYAVQMLNSILEDGELGELLIALRQMTKAFGGVQAVAEKANLNPTQLYRTLSAEGNPALSTLAAILKTMGLRLAVEPVRAA